MAYTRIFNGSLTAYRGGGKNIYPRDDQSHYVIGNVGEGEYIDYLYGVLSKFDFSSIGEDVTVSKITASIKRIKGEANLTYSVSFFYSPPSVNVDEIARTGYTEVYAYRTAANFTGGANENDSYVRTFSVEPSYFQNLKNNGLLMHGSWTQHRRMEIGEVTLSVETNEEEYKLLYDANGGAGIPDTQFGIGVSSITFDIPDTIPTKNNYKFVGWSNSKSGATLYAPGTSITVTTTPYTLYAIWELNVGTINFDANTGTDAPDPVSDVIGTAITISESVPVKNGWSFVSWNTKPDGSGTDYPAGAIYSISSEATTLYAKYVENTRTVTYDANGGEGAPNEQTAVLSKEIVLSGSIPFKKGHLFRGWSESSTASEPQYLPGNVYLGKTDITLYALWRAAEYSAFRYDGSKWVPVSDVFYNDGPTWDDKTIPYVNDPNHEFKTTKL